LRLASAPAFASVRLKEMCAFLYGVNVEICCQDSGIIVWNYAESCSANDLAYTEDILRSFFEDEGAPRYEIQLTLAALLELFHLCIGSCTYAITGQGKKGDQPKLGRDYQD
jgi:hypothetical protein